MIAKGILLKFVDATYTPRKQGAAAVAQYRLSVMDFDLENPLIVNAKPEQLPPGLDEILARHGEIEIVLANVRATPIGTIEYTLGHFVSPALPGVNGHAAIPPPPPGVGKK